MRLATVELSPGDSQIIRRTILLLDPHNPQTPDSTGLAAFGSTALGRGLSMIRPTDQSYFRASRGRLGMPAQAMSASSMVSHGHVDVSRGVIRGGCSAQIFSCLQRNFSLPPPLPSEKENERVTCHSVTGATSSPLPRHPPASAGPNPSAPVRPARLPLAPELCCPTCSARTAGFTAAGLSESGSSTRRARASAEPDNRRRVHYTFLTGRRMQCRPFFTASTDSRFAICIARGADGLAATLPGAAGACRTVRELCVLCVD